MGNPHSFGRSGSLSGSGKVDIRLVAGIGRAACVILLRKESPERGKSVLLWKEWKSVRQWEGKIKPAERTHLHRFGPHSLSASLP